ncbi:probable E3 ubiquitin-protein ligase HECTD2 isoform X2 [Limulus polyphemus]|uniref:HECT-type E3 ubiquitin transferase n=1 Tax=Limulus polyphemus TaxID=6850 RepID=A0ABM1T2X1_LIMPO|nr:probable E3 ubiquitin-protein ligase HECTD2 isoform X2 [Limulus polyphemus]XP_022250228.1 probable E3 ubiquitin-protein ligase HECTD2 isoform X2 [Limulus polyphemus]
MLIGLLVLLFGLYMGIYLSQNYNIPVVDSPSELWERVCRYESHRPYMQFAGFGPLLTEGLGVIHTYITGLLLPPSSPNSNSALYLSLPPIQQTTEGRLVSVPGNSQDSDVRNNNQAFSSARSRGKSSISQKINFDDDVIVYPNRQYTVEVLREEIEEARSSGEFTKVQEIYETTFSSLVELNAVFKERPQEEVVKADNPEIKVDLLNAVYDNLTYLPSFVSKTVLKGLITALTNKDERLMTKDDTRAFYILIQNPIFASQSSYNVLAHLLKRIIGLTSADHQLLIRWFTKLDAERFRYLVKRLLQFITIREFPPANGHKLPSISKSRWWIPCATRILALINTANSRTTPNLISYTEFYNSALDHINLMAEYYRWQNTSKHNKFSYCQYPFILSIVAKKTILQRDSEQQMILNARRSLLSRTLLQQAADIDVFFLNLNVRRSHLVSDSLNEVARKQSDLKKKLKVTFVGEPGLDMGGLTKEWFLLLIKQIFDTDYGMFVYHKKARCYWFSTAQMGNLREYNLIGVLMGLAVYNSTILDLHFPTACYKKLLSPPVVPKDLGHAEVGLCNFSMDDFAEVMPDVAIGLKELLVYEGNVEEDFCMNFQVSVAEFGDVKTHVLKPDGENIPVTNENREEYVQLYKDLILNKAIYKPFKAFYLGFHSVCASNALIMLRPEEVEMLVCGSPTLDMEELRKVTEYDGFQEDEPIIKEFWEVVKDYNQDLQKQFLRFTTGSDRVPVGGMGEMSFKISALNHNTEMLPISHTCFNQLVLPRYKSKDILKEKLTIAISNAEGFGLE